MADETGAVVPSEDRTTVSIKLDVPDILKVPEGSLLLLQALGEGVQVYDCKPSANDPAKGAWTFREPKATLYDDAGNILPGKPMTVAQSWAPFWKVSPQTPAPFRRYCSRPLRTTDPVC